MAHLGHKNSKLMIFFAYLVCITKDDKWVKFGLQRGNFKKSSNDYKKVAKKRKKILTCYFWLCSEKKYANINLTTIIEYAWIWQSSKYGRVINMQELHSILSMLEYALTEFWIYLMFQTCEDSEYGRGLNVFELYGFWICNNMTEDAWIGHKYAWICLNLW